MLWSPHLKITDQRELAVLQKSRAAVATVLKERLRHSGTLEDKGRTHDSVSDGGLDNALDEILGTNTRPHADGDDTVRTLVEKYKPAPNLTNAPQSGERVTVYGAQGEQRSIPRSDLSAALASGYSLSKPASDSVRPSSVLRIEPREGNNLFIYLRTKDFEIVPYPDRDDFVRTLGKAWCTSAGEGSHWLLPSIYIYDIRTGGPLARHNCVLQ